MKNILVLSAHPDDETLGCGGTLHRLHKEGHKIQLLTFTDGESSRGGNKKNRNLLLDKVSDILGINKYSFSNFPDNAMDSIPLLDLCKFIESEVQEFPDMIFTHFHNDLNIDHKLVAKATFTVFRPQYGKSYELYSYFIPSSTDFNPASSFNANTYFKLSKNDIDKKIEALKVYENEMRKYPHSRSFTNLINLSKVWGSEVGTEFCEKFINLRIIK